MTTKKTAFSYLSPQFPVFEAELSVSEARSRISELESSEFASVFVTNRKKELLGRVLLSSLIKASPDELLQELALPVPASLLPEADLETVARAALQYDVSEIAVVGEDGFLRGVIPSRCLIEILRLEHVEDLHRIAGITRENDMAKTAIECPPKRRVRHRLPWLLVGCVGSAAAILITSQLETSILGRIEIAFFVPAIVYIADAVGTQTEAVVIRALSLTDCSIGKSFWGEIRSGALISLFLGILTFAFVYLSFLDTRLSMAVSGSVSVAAFTAATLGFLLPSFLQKLGQDPAFGSGPLATIIQDIMSLVIYVFFVRTLL